jgi:hypothetical protein
MAGPISAMSEASIHLACWSPEAGWGAKGETGAHTPAQGSMMKLRTGLLALVATGGAAALAFGGTAASTAFSQDASGTITANAATVGMTTSHMTTSLSGLAPGGSASTTVYVENTSTTPAAFYPVSYTHLTLPTN